MFKIYIHSKEDNMIMKYSNEFILNMVLGDPTTCVYQFIYDETESNDTNIIQYFIKHGMGLCVKLYSFVAYMFYACSFSHNIAVPIALNKNNVFLFFNTYTTVFDWGDGNFSKNITEWLD